MLENVVSRYLRKWLGVPRSFSSINLYGRENKLQLPLKEVVEKYKATKARQVMMIKDSADEKVSIKNRGKDWPQVVGIKSR